MSPELGQMHKIAISSTKVKSRAQHTSMPTLENPVIKSTARAQPEFWSGRCPALNDGRVLSRSK